MRKRSPTSSASLEDLVVDLQGVAVPAGSLPALASPPVGRDRTISLNWASATAADDRPILDVEPATAPAASRQAQAAAPASDRKA